MNASRKKPCLERLPYLPLDLWFELIFTRLELDDMVRVRRVCRTFEACAKLRASIAVGVKLVFGNMLQHVVWNRMSVTLETYMRCDLEGFRKRPFSCLSYKNGNFCAMGLFSSKERIMRLFVLDYESFRKNVTSMERYADKCRITYKMKSDDYISVHYRGVADEIAAYINAHPI